MSEREPVRSVEGSAPVGEFDQSTPPAPRDGLAGSDEAVEAAAKAGYEHCRDVEETEWERGRWERLEPAHRERYLRAAHRAVTAAEPFIAARVRAERLGEHDALVEEVRKVRTEAAEAVAEERQLIINALVAHGSVCPVHGDSPTTVAEPSVGTGTPGDVESEVRGRAHGSGVYGDLEAARAPDIARQQPRRLRAPTSDEEVSGGSGHAERQEMVIQAALDGISWELIGEPSSRTMASPREAAKIVGRLVWESRDAEVARYRAAVEHIRKAIQQARVSADDWGQWLLHAEVVPYPAQRRLLGVLAATLGDGAE